MATGINRLTVKSLEGRSSLSRRAAAAAAARRSISQIGSVRQGSERRSDDGAKGGKEREGELGGRIARGGVRAEMPAGLRCANRPTEEPTPKKSGDKPPLKGLWQ